MRKRSFYSSILALTLFPASLWAQATDTLTLTRSQLTDENFKVEAGQGHQSVLDLRSFISGDKDISLVRLFAKGKWGEPYVALRVSSKDKVLSGLTIKEAEDFSSDDERSFFNHDLTNYSRGAHEEAELVFVGRVQSVPADQQVIKIHKIEVVFGVPSEMDQVSVALDQAAVDVGAAGDAAKQAQPQVVELGQPALQPVPDPVPTPKAKGPVVTPEPAPRVEPQASGTERRILLSNGLCVAKYEIEFALPRSGSLIIREGQDVLIRWGRSLESVRFLECSPRTQQAWIYDSYGRREHRVDLRDLSFEHEQPQAEPVRPAPRPEPRPAPVPAPRPSPKPAPDVLFLRDTSNRTVEVRPGDRILLFIQGTAVPVTYVGPSRNSGEVMVRLPNQREAVSRRLSSLRAERR